MIVNRNNGDDTQIDPESAASIKKTQASDGRQSKVPVNDKQNSRSNDN
jgi:hypothetical protein